MNNSPLHSTKRELQRLVASRSFWLTISAVALTIGVIGPFGTYDSMQLGLRLAYWAVVAVLTYLVGHGVVSALRVLHKGERQSHPAAWAAYGAIAGIPVAATVLALNTVSFGASEAVPALQLGAATIAVSAMVSLLVGLFEGKTSLTSSPPMDTSPGEARPVAAEQPAEPAAPLQPHPRPPRILARLPHGQRGQLSHMSMQDHYVEVRTDGGAALVLMRFSDAMAETDGIGGLQIHRSHWVARDMVTGATRVEGKLMLQMRDGALLPVSRKYADAVRAAGLA